MKTVNLIEIKKSLIPNAGLGVFAVCDIPPNTYLTIYPGPLIPNRDIFLKKNKNILTRSKKYIQVFTEDLPSADYAANLATINPFPENYLGVLAPDPKCKNLTACAHLANDAHKLSDFVGSNQAKLSEVELYLVNSSKKSNLYLVANISEKVYYAYSSRFINAGEEIYHFYGLPYWSFNEQINLPKILNLSLQTLLKEKC